MGVSRYEKFRHITTEILGGPYTEEDERRLGERFSELVLDEVLACPFVPGAPGAARAARSRAAAVRRVRHPGGGAADDRLAREVDALFPGVYGTPPTKGADHRAGSWTRRALDRDDVVMVGDARSDLKGARERRASGSSGACRPATPTRSRARRCRW